MGSTQTDVNWPTNHGEIDEAPEFGYPFLDKAMTKLMPGSLPGELQHFPSFWSLTPPFLMLIVVG